MVRQSFPALLLTLGLTSTALAQPCGVPVVFQPLSGISGSQVAIDFDPSDPSRLIALDINGPVRSYNTTTGAVTTMLTLTGSAGQGGGYGLAVDLLYATTGAVYIFFPTGATSSVLRYSRSALNPAILDPASRTIILQIPTAPTQHTGGWMGFGPDGYLYIGVGDHGLSSNAQTNTVLMGKMLRIDIRSDDFPADANRNYAIPPTNPFIGTTSPPEVICRGVRNPFRCAFDSPSGALFIADVGSATREEVNRIGPADGLGQNFGWPCREGLTSGPGGASDCGSNMPVFTNPIVDFNRSQLGCITGGLVYHGTAIPGLIGRYLAGSCTSSSLYSFDPSNPVRSLRTHAGAQTAYCFAANAQGEVFAGLTSGIARILPAAPPSVDCNHNGIPDACEIAGGLETDFNANGILDSCERTCRIDFDVNGIVNQDDIFSFIAQWFSGHLAADFNASGDLTVQDIFDFIAAWFAGC